MFRSAFKPADHVKTSGVYWVHHYAHRVSHPARLKEGDLFPTCHTCGERVRFELASPDTEPKAQPIEVYADFREVA